MDKKRHKCTSCIGEQSKQNETLPVTQSQPSFKVVGPLIQYYPRLDQSSCLYFIPQDVVKRYKFKTGNIQTMVKPTFISTENTLFSCLHMPHSTVTAAVGQNQHEICEKHEKSEEKNFNHKDVAWLELFLIQSRMTSVQTLTIIYF